MVGRTLAQYRIEERLGRGEMGDVYRAVDTRLRRPVAEARAAAAVEHPAIATIHEVGEVDGVDFIVMEWVSGATLREAFAGRRVDARELAELGLEAAHGHGIVHGDIKPNNLMAQADNRIKILDFGVAGRTAERPLGATLRKTAAG